LSAASRLTSTATTTTTTTTNAIIIITITIITLLEHLVGSESADVTLMSQFLSLYGQLQFMVTVN